MFLTSLVVCNAGVEWHLFAILFLMSSAYTLLKDEHVRVDLLYSKYDRKKKAWIDLIGTVLFLIPFCFGRCLYIVKLC